MKGKIWKKCYTKTSPPLYIYTGNIKSINDFLKHVILTYDTIMIYINEIKCMILNPSTIDRSNQLIPFCSN